MGNDRGASLDETIRGIDMGSGDVWRGFLGFVQTHNAFRRHLGDTSCTLYYRRPIQPGASVVGGPIFIYERTRVEVSTLQIC